VSSYIIGITGGSGSGKTSLIDSLKTHFDKNELCVVSQDDYYFPREIQRKDSNGICNFDLPTSVDLKALVRDVEKLKSGKIVKRKEYTFNNPNQEAKMLKFTPAPVLLIEGLFIFAEAALFQQFDLSIFVHAKENLKVIRRIKRDQLERNYPLDDVLYRYQNHVLPAFEKFIAPFREEADIVINNNKNFNAGLEALKALIHSKNAVVENKSN
jgi:uridine kinase